MNQEISRWIVEFLVRQRVDDSVLESLLSTLPLQDDDSQLKKALLLRKIRTEVTNGSVSEKILDLLELLGEMEFREGKVASETMKAAYCAVAVDCTVRFLDEEMENNGKYLEILKRICRGRVQKMENSENSGLISEELRSWRDDLEAASLDVEICGKILSRNTRNEALKAVKGYVAEAWNDMGPSFLEKTAENVDKIGKVRKEDKGVQVSEIVECVDVSHNPTLASKEPGIDGNHSRVRPSAWHDVSVNEPGEEKGIKGVENAVEPHDGLISSGRPAVDSEDRQVKGGIENDISVQEPSQRAEQVHETLDNGAASTCGTFIGVGDGSRVKPGSEQSLPLHGTSTETGKVVQVPVRYKHSAHCSRVKRHRPAKIADHEEMDEDISVNNSGPDVSRVQEGLGSCNKALSDAPRVEQTKSTGIEAHNTHTDMEVQAVNAPTNNGDDIQQKDSTMEDFRGNEDNSKCPSEEDQKSPSRATLPDKSAVAYRLLDSEEASPGAYYPNQPHLPSPKKRKPKRRWTPLEEDTLRAGVKKFGKGNWKLILHANRDVFQGRTEVDLKDKWRNMIR